MRFIQMADEQRLEMQFVNEGDLIQIDTRDGSYLSRVKE